MPLPWISPDGDLGYGAEDVGRHVALDKLLGMRARRGETPGAVLVSSHASYKCYKKRPCAGWKSCLPFSLAVEVAERCGLTLVGFSKPGRAMVFTHPTQIVEDVS